MSTVATREITKLFDRVRAVDAISLTAREGEFLVLLGPSGCGKTTLMRMIAGLEQPSEGDVLIDGQVVTALPPRARNVAMVFQSYALYPHLTVERNISFPLRAQGMARAAVREKVEWAAAMFGIGRLLQRKPRQLSGGERQRVALARAVVRKPVVFLLDEPLSNLDAKLRTSARDELKEFQRRLGTTTIYVTHDQVEAMGLGDRIAVLDHGRVRQVSTPSDIYHEPADTFVATFIGSPPMNLVERDGMTLGFRPEHFLPVEVGDLGLNGAGGNDGSGGMTFPVRVTRTEYLGADQLIYGVLEAPFPEIHVISRLPWMAQFASGGGERHEFVVRPANLKRFEARTGLRLDGEGGG